MKQTFLNLLVGSIVLIAGVFVFGVQSADSLECSWTEYEYRCTEGYWTSQYTCTWYDPPPYQSCTPSTTYVEQCGWEVQCDSDDTNCKLVKVCTQVAVPSTNCTTIDPAPYKVCEYDTVWVPGSCGNYPTVKQQTCSANSETACSYATECSTSGSKTVTSYSCGSSGCVAGTTTATCTRTFDTCTNNVGETGYVCGGSCTAPPNKTLSVSVTANPSSGKAPLKNVQITADVGGTATGTITYKLDCTNDLVYDATETSSSTSYTFPKKCDYDTAGAYTVRVNVTRQTLGTSNTASVSVTAGCDSTSFTACSTAKDFGSGGSIGLMCGADQYYQAVVPAGKTCDVLFSVTPDSGADYDLYVENTAAACPSTTAWDCTSTNRAGINDQCTATQLGPGTYKALVHKYGGTGSYAIASSVYNCKTISLSFPSTTWQRLWYNDPKTNNFSDASFLGEGPNQSIEQFDDDWKKGTVAYGKADQIGFRASRTIDFTNKEGTYYFEPGADDGVRLYIDGELLINSWIDTGFFFRGVKKEMTSGPHQFLFEYYENTTDARAAFKYNFAQCNKTSFVTDDTASVTIPTATGTKQCQVTIKHSGQDLTDSSAVKYETTSTGSRSRKVEMDDAPTTNGSCDLDLSFYTEWNNPASGFFTVKSMAQEKAAANDLLWNYTLAASGCVVKDVLSNGNCLNDAAYNTGDTSACALPTISSTTSAIKKHGVRRNYGIADGNYVRSDFTFSLVECTQDSHCSPNTGKTYCNGGATLTSTNFPLNTCIDSIPPTSTINESAVASGSDGSRNWFKAGGYNIPVTDEDADSGVDNTACIYRIKDLGTGTTSLYKTRDCGSTSAKTISVVVDVGRDCETEGENKCEIEVWTRDKAGNLSVTKTRLNIDRTPPTAQ